jgi:polyphosphate kinase
MSILTSSIKIGKDAELFFDAVAAHRIPLNFKHLLLAPTKMHRKLLRLIDAETKAAEKGKSGRIFAKVNALVDNALIEKLYRASQAGVKVDLIVRGACSLIPGIPGISDNIRVTSIVDKYLEHSRLYYFKNSKKLYLSSADWMQRNFFSRLEIAFPVLDPRIYKYIEEVVIPTYLNDTAKARELTPQGTWKRRVSLSGQDLRAQEYFEQLALKSYRGTPLADQTPVSSKTRA